MHESLGLIEMQQPKKCKEEVLLVFCKEDVLLVFSK
jgi:hypothetical protein